jgi:hypothetical protein
MRENDAMEFRNKIEAVLTPLVRELREKLALLPTIDVLNYYQLRIDAVQTDKSSVPDGFIFKWRYLWALLLSLPFSEMDGYFEPEMKQLDHLIERVFQTYEFGAVNEPGRFKGSEKEFLTRLGLALRVREPDLLAFPEQIQSWASARLQPFDDSYFVPVFGLHFEEIIAWISRLIAITESRLNACVQDLVSIRKDATKIQAEFIQGGLDFEAARYRAKELKLEERLDANARLGESIHILSTEDARCGIPERALQALLEQFALPIGAIESEYKFPHDENPLEHKTFIVLPDGRLYFLDPANVSRIVAKTLEREILADERLRTRYLRNRDRATERWVTECVKRVFSGAAIYPNYYLEKGAHEKDLLVRYKDTLVLIECKNAKIRAFRGAAADLLKFERDFENSVQFGYEQALEVKSRILGAEETQFFDEKGRPYFSIKRSEIKRLYLVCVTIVPRGPFGTDLSYQLKKPEKEPYPLALNLLDFDTICKHLSKPEQFIQYLQSRERLHGRVRTGDELNYAGYFLRFGHLDFEDETLVTDEFSGVFDRAWFKEKGVHVDEPKNPPVVTKIIRQGNRMSIQQPTGRKETIKVPPEWIERATGRPAIQMKGSQRNRPCPCGSGRKLKNCHGT